MFALTTDQVTAFINADLDKTISAATAAGLTTVATELSAFKTFLGSAPNIMAGVTNAFNTILADAESEITAILGGVAMKALGEVLGTGTLFGSVVTTAQAAASKPAA